MTFGPLHPQLAGRRRTVRRRSRLDLLAGGRVDELALDVRQIGSPIELRGMSVRSAGMACDTGLSSLMP